MFFDNIIIQPDCKMLFLLCLQSVNHYTSMLLSFLGVLEIHSVDWVGLVFVLPLLKNKNINRFQCMCTFTVLIQVCDQTWVFHSLFEGHLCCFRSIGSPSTKGLCPCCAKHSTAEVGRGKQLLPKLPEHPA